MRQLGFGAIGQSEWPGLAKIIEECGELLQIAGKIVAFSGTIDHPSGYHTQDKLEEEMADVLAAIKFTMNVNKMNIRKIVRRAKKKEALFHEWHELQTWSDWVPGKEVPKYEE